MKTPKGFDYDLWIAEDGQYMVRVKATREVCAVSQEVFRKLRSEEKKLRREMETPRLQDANGQPMAAANTVVSLDFVSVEDDLMDAAWLIDPSDFEQDLILRESIQELRAQLTERQLEVFEKCMLGGMGLREYALKNGIKHPTIVRTCDAIRKKFINILGDRVPNAK